MDFDLPEDSEFDESTDAEVQDFAHSICEWIYERFPDSPIDLEEDFALNDTETMHSRRMSVSTNFGAVMILPDFRKQSAAAVVINLGMIRGMQKEGFDDKFIEENGQIYSDPIPFTDSSVEILGYYLTHKINIRK